MPETVAPCLFVVTSLARRVDARLLRGTVRGIDTLRRCFTRRHAEAVVANACGPAKAAIGTGLAFLTAHRVHSNEATFAIGIGQALRLWAMVGLAHPT